MNPQDAPPVVDFAAMVPGMPATEAEAQTELRAQLSAQGSAIANSSPFSPFFLLLSALLVWPWMLVRQWIVESYLPSIFIAKAEDAALDLLGWAMDEERKAASKAQGYITFVRSGTAGNLPIPINTLVQSPPIDGVVYGMRTLAAGEIPDGQAQAAILAEAVDVGAGYNLGDGYYSILPVDIAGVIQVENAADWLVTPGRNVEADDDYRLRLRLKWRRQGQWHVDDVYRSLISDVAGIEPENVYFGAAIPRGPGSRDAYIITDSGLPDSALVDLADDYINVAGNHGEGDDLQVKAMPALSVPVNLVLWPNEDATEDDIDALLADGENLIRAAFRQNAAYPDVPRVAPFHRVARSNYSGHLHDHLALLDAVDWTYPAADPAPGLELPVIQSAALDLAAVTDEGGGKVGLPATAHGIADGVKVKVSGTGNYNGTFALDAASSADKIVIVHAYVAEVLAGVPKAEALVLEIGVP